MDVSFINPFIGATIETFKTMLRTELTTGTPVIKQNATHSYDVSGVIGLSGEAQGVIAISFPKIVSLKTISKFLGEDVKIVGPDLIDGIGEIANIIAGYAKQGLTQYKLSISLPNVVIGTNHKISTQSGVPTMIIPLKGDIGEFALEVALKTR